MRKSAGFVMALGLLGCHSGQGNWERVPLTGVVTYEGQRLSGTLTLVPATGHKGPAASTAVQEGVFSFTTQNGPVAGPHLATLRMEAQGATTSDTAPTAGRAAMSKAGTNSGGANPPEAAAGAPQFHPKMVVDVVIPAEAPYELNIGS
jgi:hypothetical protein